MSLLLINVIEFQGLEIQKLDLGGYHIDFIFEGFP